MTNPYKVYFYKNASGRSPVIDFLEKLDAYTYARVLRHLDLLQSQGPNLGMPYSRAFGKGLFELRVHAKRPVRIFYIFQQGREIWVLHAFVKKRQKTALQEFALAQKRKKDLKGR